MITRRVVVVAVGMLWVAAVLPAAAQTEPGSKPTVNPETKADPKPLTSCMEAAKTVTAAIQKDFFNEKTGLYAQSLSKREPEFMWGNGVMFSALVAAARHEPGTYRPVLERFFAGMDRYWDAKAKAPGYEPSPTNGNGHDKYYDDNQWMVITFMEAYDLTGEAKYLERARQTLAFCLSGWDEELGGGIWWHEGHKGGCKNTCANAPAAVACLSVGRAGEEAGRAENVEWARKLVKWTNEHLQDGDGLFFDNQRVSDGRIDKRKFTYNTALMLRANLGLYRATGEGAFLAEAKRIGAACDGFVKKETGTYRDSPRFTHLLVEADLELYRGTGDAGVLARARKNGEAAWKRWQTSPPKELIEQAAIARLLWLLADQETEVGRVFWERAEKGDKVDVPPAGK
ncbi:MAG: glycoside hydrolase family 76 protein [Phycisphaerales bacterium]